MVHYAFILHITLINYIALIMLMSKNCVLVVKQVCIKVAKKPQQVTVLLEYLDYKSPKIYLMTVLLE